MRKPRNIIEEIEEDLNGEVFEEIAYEEYKQDLFESQDMIRGYV